jgi:hypothetical protein
LAHARSTADICRLGLADLGIHDESLVPHFYELADLQVAAERKKLYLNGR